MRDLQPLALDPFQTFDNRLHRSALSRKHDAGRPIHGGDGKRRSLALFGRVGCEKLPHTPFVALHRHHDSPLRQCAHQPSACGGQLQPILQAENSSHRGRCEFADAVAEQKIRFSSPGEPERRQRILQGKEGWLCIFGAVDGIVRRVRPVAEHLQQRCFHLASQQFGAAVEGLAEEGLGRVEFLPHADDLRALAGEEKGELGPQLLFGLFS